MTQKRFALYVSDPFGGQSTDQRGIFLSKAFDMGIWCFLCCLPKQVVVQSSDLRRHTMTLKWCRCHHVFIISIIWCMFQGPHAWHGARDAIMTTMQRVIIDEPINRRLTNDTSNGRYILAGVVGLAVAMGSLYFWMQWWYRPVSI